MVNNAGIANGPSKSSKIWDCNESDWDKVMSVNAKGVMLGCKYAARQMKEQEPGPRGDRGWIVNIASILGLVGISGAGMLSLCKVLNRRSC